MCIRDSTITSHAPKNDVDPMLSNLPEGSSAVPVHSGAREATDDIIGTGGGFTVGVLSKLR